MAKGRRTAKPYDASNSFVKKVATKVTDLIPQRSWISKWFNNSQDNGEMLEDAENQEEVESEEDMQKPPPSKRPCIRMDVTYPPGTFSIQPRGNASSVKGDDAKQYAVHDETSDDFCEPAAAGPSGSARLISSTPATERDVRSIGPPQRSELNSLAGSANNGTANGTDDNSESSESTSGCSSLIPQTNRQEAPSNASYNFGYSGRKRFMEDKLNFTNHLQSPRSLFLDSTTRDSLSSRRPSFNASVMTNTTERSSPLSSPFYSGNITFGGANAAGLYQRKRSFFNNSNESQLKVPRRTNVEVKPSNSASVDSSGMSQTAKKILEALEHFSSPITDAKKIPLKGNSVAASGSKKRARDEAASPAPRVGLRHMTRELTVPTVPDILKLRRRQKLQDSTVVARRIVSARSDPPPANQEYQLGSQVEDESKRQNKLKAKTKTNLDQEETVDQVPLTSIPLPITSLPNFNFTLPTNPNPPEKPSVKPNDGFTFASPIKITSAVKALKSINNFTFSSPISAEDKSQRPGRTFEQATVNSSTPQSLVSQNFIWSSSSTAPRPREKKKTEPGPVAASTELRSGSVMDVLSKGVAAEATEKERSESKAADACRGAAFGSVWECAECLIKNSSAEGQCVACKASRPGGKDKKAAEASSPADGAAESKSLAGDCFGSQFKLLTGQWECAACYVRNKQTDVKCAACNSPKAAGKAEEKVGGSKAPGDLSKFNPPEGSWECPGCMLRNAATQTVCHCCNASKPNVPKSSPKRKEETESSGRKSATEASKESTQAVQPPCDDLMAKFRPPKDSWECPCCMVRNNATTDTCPLCNTAKPSSGGKKAPQAAQPPSNGFGDKFKKPEGAWICDACMLQNNASAGECVACGGAKPGAKKTGTGGFGGPSGSGGASACGSGLQFSFGIPPAAAGFKFGIDKAEVAKDATASVNGFKFGDKSAQPAVDASSFTFGIQKDDAESRKADGTATLASKGEASAPTQQTEDKNTEKPASEFKIQSSAQSEEKEKKIQPAFSFGVPKTETAALSVQNPVLSTSTVSTVPATGFTFGVPKPETKTSDAAKERETPTSLGAPEAQKPAAPAALATGTTDALQKSKAPWFSFGVPQSSASATGSASTVPSTTAPAPAPAIQPSAAFAEAKPATQTASSVPSFGQISASAASVAPTGVFAFGENKIADSTATAQAKPAASTPSASIFSSIGATPSLFGSGEPKTSTFGGEDNKSASFGASAGKPSAFVIPEAKVPAFGSTEAKPSIFGAPEVQSQKLPVFDAPDKPAPVFSAPQATVAAPAPAFGAPTSNPPLFGTSAPPVFGNNPTSTFGAPTASIFSTAKPGETSVPNTNLFTFGMSSGQPAAQTSGGFNFSAGAPATETAQKPLFTFGSVNNQAQGGNLFGGGNFSGAAPAGGSGFNFNAPKQEAPAFGQPAATQPMFGAPQSTAQGQGGSFAGQSSGTGFNFGFNAQPASSGSSGFNFGEMSQSPATSDASTGFKFNPPSTTPTFDPNTRPSFNFTGGNAPPTFSAPPQQPTPQHPMPRRFKKAIRRTRDRPN